MIVSAWYCNDIQGSLSLLFEEKVGIYYSVPLLFDQVLPM